MTNTRRRLGNSPEQSLVRDPHPGSTAMTGRAPLTVLGRSEIERVLAALGEPSYRTAQLLRWVYQRGANDYAGMTDLPSSLRNVLANEMPIVLPRLAARETSSVDGTRRYLWELYDGVTVESVGLPTKERLTVCFSTQAGCAMGCSFCATGASGLKRSLGAGEMAMQVMLVGADLGRSVTNAVAMGQGEPFAAYDATLAGLRLMNDADALGIGARHLTVSTCGIVAGINRLSAEPEQFTLAVSIHSAIQTTRDHLVPAMRKQPLSELRSALQRYIAITGRRPSLEYALIGGVNDSAAELDALISFCRGLHCHVNIIPVNPTPVATLARPSGTRAREFASALTRSGTEASVRIERGADIEAACGQLTQRRAADR